MTLSRRSFLAGSAAAAVASLRAPSVHAQKRGGTLRFVPHADLKILDPIWTTAYITRNHGYMIFDTLFALDADLKLRPQMVDKYTVSKDSMRYSFTLRDGLKFHDDMPVRSADVIASIRRWAKNDTFGRAMMRVVSSPSSSTTGFLTLILAIKDSLRGHGCVLLFRWPDPSKRGGGREALSPRRAGGFKL